MLDRGYVYRGWTSGNSVQAKFAECNYFPNAR